MARRRKNPDESTIALVLGVIGGGAAVWLYMNSIQKAAAAQGGTLTVTTPPLPQTQQTTTG